MTTANISAQQFLEEEADQLAKVSRTGAQALRERARKMEQEFATGFQTLQNSLRNDPSPSDTLIHYQFDILGRGERSLQKLRDDNVLAFPGLSMRASVILCKFEDRLGREYADKAEPLLQFYTHQFDREIKSGLIKTTQTVRAGIEEEPEWAQSVPDTIVILGETVETKGDDVDGKPASDLKQVDPGALQFIASLKDYPVLDKEIPLDEFKAAPSVQPSVTERVVDQWAPDILERAARVIADKALTTTNPREFLQNELKTVRQETQAELEKRRAEGQTPEQVHHIFQYADFLRDQNRKLNDRVKAEDLARARSASAQPVKPQQDAPRGFLSRLKDTAATGLALTRAVVEAARDTAADHLRDFMKRPRRAAAGFAVSAAAAIGITAGINSSTPEQDSAPQAKAPAAANVAQSPVEVSETKAAPETTAPAAASEFNIAQAPAAPVKTAKAKPLAQPAVAAEPYKTPDELSVTFNGARMKADIFTVKAACDQINYASSICDDFKPGRN